MTPSIQRELRFPQSPGTVWRSLTSSAELAVWMFPNDFEPKVGHRFTFRVPPKPGLDAGLIVRCEVLTCVPTTELSFTWVVDGFLDTRVSYRLVPEGSGTRVLFEHSGFEAKAARGGAEYGWKLMHAALTETLAKSGSS